MSESLAALCEAARELVRRGLVLGSGGNVSLRADDTVYITPRGAALDRLHPDMFVPVHVETGAPRGDGTPSSELPMHVACYRSRADARVVIHCHPSHAIAVASLGLDLPALTPDFFVYIGATHVPTVPYITPGTQALADAVAKRLHAAPVVLLGNHGLIAVGERVEQTLTRVLLVEETARIYLLARRVGEPRILTHDDWADLTQTRYNT